MEAELGIQKKFVQENYFDSDNENDQADFEDNDLYSDDDN